MEQMTQEQAIDLLIQIAHRAQAKGILRLDEAALTLNAISLFQSEPKEKPEVTEPEK